MSQAAQARPSQRQSLRFNVFLFILLTILTLVTVNCLCVHMEDIFSDTPTEVNIIRCYLTANSIHSFTVCSMDSTLHVRPQCSETLECLWNIHYLGSQCDAAA